jgi:hypothetical protein
MPEKFICPLERDSNHAIRHSHNLTTALRRLRRNLAACRHCPGGPDCPLRARFQMQVDEALMELTLEWELDGEN